MATQKKYVINREKIRPVIVRVLKQRSGQMREQMIKQLKQDGKKASGDLINSVVAEVEELKTMVRASIGPTAKYGEYVEFGIKPTFPPHKPIAKWIDNKFKMPRKKRDRFAFAVRLKIAKEGIEGAPYVEPVYRKHLKTLDEYLARQLVKAL